MNFTPEFQHAFALVFVRCSAMVLSSPLFGALVPVQVRVLFSAVVALALTPMLQDAMPPLPGDMLSLGLQLGMEVAVGLIIGMMLQFLLAVFQMAGSFLDVTIGLNSAQVFNPMAGGQSAPVGRLKFLLGLVLLLLLDAHHLMLQAFVQSYRLPGLELVNLEAVVPSYLGVCSLLAVQIAAPVAAVSLVIDAAAGLVNKAVPQSQPFLISLPIKTVLGLFMLAVGLPALAAATHRGVQISFEAIYRALGG